MVVWSQVDKAFINKMFQYLRCVCSVMLQDKVYDFGFDATTVELGIVSLGTSTADGTKKAVKVCHCICVCSCSCMERSQRCGWRVIVQNIFNKLCTLFQFFITNIQLTPSTYKTELN